MHSFSMSYWVLIKFPYFMDTTKIGVTRWKEAQRHREVKVNFWISLLTKIDIQVKNHLRSLWRKDGSWMDSSGRHDAITHCTARPSLSLSTDALHPHLCACDAIFFHSLGGLKRNPSWLTNCLTHAPISTPSAVQEDNINTLPSQISVVYF
jgi:hypothetical protein